MDTPACAGGDAGTYRDEITFATGAEVITDRLRGTIVGVFSCSRAFDLYNVVETGMMAFERGHHDGRHLCAFVSRREEPIGLHRGVPARLPGDHGEVPVQDREPLAIDAYLPLEKV